MCNLALYFSQEQDFLESMSFVDLQVLQQKLEPRSLTSLSQILFGAGFPVEHIFRRFSGAPAEMKTILE
jgi:hypothetical protein